MKTATFTYTEFDLSFKTTTVRTVTYSGMTLREATEQFLTALVRLNKEDAGKFQYWGDHNEVDVK